jgi:hypothetical protein
MNFARGRESAVGGRGEVSRPRALLRVVALAVASLAAMTPARALRAQDATRTILPTASSRASVPFGAGERLDYDVKFGFVKVGSGQMEVVGTESIRGREAWRARFVVSGGIPGYRVNDRMESWFDTSSLESLRFIQDLEEGRRDREYHYEIFPERNVYQEKGKPEKPTVDNPLDDASFLYFVRTMPLEVGKTYEIARYFVPDRNPVTIKVLRKERVTVPAGTFETVVVQPTFKSKGLFSKDGRAEIWLSDDDRRLLVQMKSTLPIGSLNLFLREVKVGSGTRTAKAEP